MPVIPGRHYCYGRRITRNTGRERARPRTFPRAVKNHDESPKIDVW
jgi:hypothetical protein